jgi:hypothetical protein
MNLFWLDFDPVLNARYHCDKHVVKMVLEATQLLCTAHRLIGQHHGYVIDPKLLYAPTHQQHPCAIYTRSSAPAYSNVWQYANALADEYTFRYGKIHKCESIIPLLKKPPVNIPSKLTEMRPQCMPIDYKHVDVITAYRRYYKFGKTEILSWSRRPVPEWLNATKNPNQQ